MSTSTHTQKTNILEYEYDYFRMYSRSSMTTLEYNHDYFHDYFNDYPVSNRKVTFMESLCVILFLLLCHYLVFSLLTDGKYNCHPGLM